MAFWAEAASSGIAGGSRHKRAVRTDNEVKALIAVCGEGNVQEELD